MEFRPYTKKNRDNEKGVRQSSVVHFRPIDFRWTGEDRIRFESAFALQPHNNRSKFIKELINEALENRKRIAWEEEIKGW